MTREYTKSAERMTRDELADVLRGGDFRGLGTDFGDACERLADAVRALPVIATCGECFWLAIDMTPRGGLCVHESLDGHDMAIGRVDAAPPARCPLRGKR